MGQNDILAFLVVKTQRLSAAAETERVPICLIALFQNYSQNQRDQVQVNFQSLLLQPFFQPHLFSYLPEEAAQGL